MNQINQILIKYINSKNKFISRWIVNVITHINPSPQTNSLLITCLKCKDEITKEMAAVELIKRGMQKGKDCLKTLLLSTSPQYKERLLEEILSIDNQLVHKLLVELLLHSNKQSKFFYLQNLYLMGKSMPLLFKISKDFLQDFRPEYKILAMEILASTGEKQYIATLHNIVKSPSSELSSLAFISLLRLKEEVPPQIINRLISFESLNYLIPAHIKEVLSFLKKAINSSQQLQIERVIEFLSQNPLPEFIPLLQELSKDKSFIIRSYIASILGSFSLYQEAFSTLYSLIKDNNPYVRQSAIITLSSISFPQKQDWLLELYSTETHPSVLIYLLPEFLSCILSTKELDKLSSIASEWFKEIKKSFLLFIKDTNKEIPWIVKFLLLNPKLFPKLPVSVGTNFWKNIIEGNDRILKMQALLYCSQLLNSNFTLSYISKLANDENDPYIRILALLLLCG